MSASQSLSENPQNGLVIFSRYPEPGRTKTRMIPVLGAIGAADLQHQMTEHTLNIVNQWTAQSSVNVFLFYTGGNLALMKNWLRDQYGYVKQGGGDLGERMKEAFAWSFQANLKKVMIIGIDCPDLTPAILQQGLEQLETHDLVLGPALDGGYYLIGAKQLIPELFKDIPWGTSEVLAKTKAIAAQCHLTTAFLAPLADVDRPEDLPLFQKYSTISFNSLGCPH